MSAQHNRYRQDWDVGWVETRGVAPSWTPACSTTLLVHVGGQWRAGGSGRRPGPTASPRDVPSRRRSCVWMSVIRFEKMPQKCSFVLHASPPPPHSAAPLLPPHDSGAGAEYEQNVTRDMNGGPRVGRRPARGLTLRRARLGQTSGWRLQLAQW